MFLPKEVNKIDEDIFYILNHTEIRELQLIMNKGIETKKGKGVDNISLKLLEQEQIKIGNWSTIKNSLNEI